MIFLETLNIVIGPTGSGKSLFEMVLADMFLRTDTRVIITTLAIDVPRFSEWLAETYGDKAPSNIAARILRIDANDLATFWRIRGITYDGDYGYIPVKRGRFGGEDWKAPTVGVVYLLDELQVKFKAREFMKNSGEFLDYQPQARKLGDTILGVSPASSLLDKGFRDLANQCIVLRNMYKLKVGMFTAPRKIIAQAYLNCPPAHGEEPLAKHEFTIDAKGLASCYKTQEGVGVIGIAADIGKVARGIPYWVIFPAALILGLVVWKLLSAGLHGGMNWGLRKMAVSNPANVTNAVNLMGPVVHARQADPSPFAAFHPGATNTLIRWTPPAPVSNTPPRKALARGFAVLNGVLYIYTRTGPLVAQSWTNSGDSILANGFEWSLSDQPPVPARKPF